MTVADLQKFLRNLAEVLEPNGGKAVAGELGYVCEKLEGFRDQKVKAFGDFLVKADEYSRGVLQPKSKAVRAPKAAKDPERLNKAIALAKSYYDRALDPALTSEEIAANLRAYGDLTKPQLETIARELDILRKFKTKADVLDAVVKLILDRKGMHERSMV